MMAGTFRFRPEQRLRRGSEFAAVLGGSRRLRGRYFELRYRDSEGITARLGLIVAKRLAKRAVVRNKVKRVAREAFRHLQSQLRPVDLVVRLASGIGPDDKVDRALKQSWRKDLEQLMLRLTP
jgi:ribonuclease P protein component